MRTTSKKRSKPLGKCLLTGTYGPFARSHIIPRFLADKALSQAHRIQFGQSGPPQLLFNSWIDQQICGDEGEKRLRDIDTAAAQVFRKHGLSWRHLPLSGVANREPIGVYDSELIRIPNVDTKSLRLFFHSLLWRSAVSSRFEFGDVVLDSKSTEYLRAIVSGEKEAKDEDWPAVALLLTDIGEPQVHAPLARIINHQAFSSTLPTIPIFRFFLDGLIVHMGKNASDFPLLDVWGSRVFDRARC